MNPMKILLVDDSKSARYALQLQLQRHGAVVETVDSAEAGLARIKESPPDVVFMDHTMPGMNGFQALDILKTAPETEHIPVVMCTSQDDPGFVAQAERKGAFSILSKSTAPDKLPGLLARLQQVAPAPLPAPPDRIPVALSVSDIQDIVRREAEILIEERLDARIRALVAPIVEELGNRLSADIDAEAEEKLAARLNTEAQRLQRTFIQAQSEQARITTNRIVNELLPQAVLRQLEQERQGLAHMVQGLIDSSLDGLAEEPAFLRRILDITQASAANSAEQLLKRRAREIAETIATDRATEVADSLIRSARDRAPSMYLLAAAAALAGIAAATLVYFLR